MQSVCFGDVGFPIFEEHGHFFWNNSILALSLFPKFAARIEGILMGMLKWLNKGEELIWGILLTLEDMN